MRIGTIDRRIECPQNSDDIPSKFHYKDSRLDIEDCGDVLARARVSDGATGTDRDGGHLYETHGNVDSCEDAEIDSEQLLVLTLVVSVVGVEDVAKETKPALDKQELRKSNIAI